MKRPGVMTLVACALIAGALAALMIVGARVSALAQAATPPAMATHPIVGAWLLDVDAFPDTAPSHVAVFHADGTYTDVSAVRGSGVGVWESIDDHTVAMNLVFYAPDESGNVGMTRIRAQTTVDDSGDAFTSTYTREIIAADGASSGELGPGSATAQRLEVEPRGEPGGSLSRAIGTPAS